MRAKHPTLSIVIPAYNEERRILNTLRDVTIALKKKMISAEIILVDDGSTDGTLDVVRAYQSETPVIIIEHEKNAGKGAAVKTGMLAANGDYHLFMDADNSVKFSQHIDLFMQEVLDTPIVIASIRLEEAECDDSKSAGYRRAAGRLAKWCIGVLVLPHISDSQRGFKIFRRDVSTLLFSQAVIERWGFDIEILARAQREHIDIKEVAVVWNNGPDSRVTLFDYIPTLIDLFRIRKVVKSPSSKMPVPVKINNIG